MTLVDRVQAFAARQQLWTPTTRVIAAVSGGADSVALACLLHNLASRGYLRLAGLAHLHHGIRGRAADEDAAFVEALAARLGVPCCRADADVPAAACLHRQSLELAGRHARLAFYREAKTRLGADAVALAHTRSDQAETVLLRLTRGAGTRGLTAMAPRAGHRVRPLLEIGRDELRRWLMAHQMAWREDATNADRRIPRNRVRHEVLPQLAAVNPRVEEALARAARIAAADGALLDELAAAEFARHVEVEDRHARIDHDRLAALPEALARRVVRAALAAVDPHRAHGWEETDAVLSGTDGVREVGAVRMERFGGRVVLMHRGVGPRPAAGPEVLLALDVPGTVTHPEGWWTVAAEGPLPPAQAPPPSPDRAVLDAAALGRHLTVRSWRAGDRVQPLGLGGRKKLQDLFVDRKVPRDERGLVPLVLDARARVAWVAGLVVAEPFRVTPATSGVVVLTLRR